LRSSLNLAIYQTSLFISSSHQQQIGRVPLEEPSLDPSLADLLAVRLKPTLPTLPMIFRLPAGTPHCYRCAVVTNGPSSSSLAMNVDTVSAESTSNSTMSDSDGIEEEEDDEVIEVIEEDSDGIRDGIQEEEYDEVIEEDSDGIEEEEEEDEQEQPQPQPQQMPPAPMKKPKKKRRTDEEVLKAILEKQLEEQDRERQWWWS